MSTPFLERQPLLKRLAAALDLGHVLIIAPGGYGKTMLLRMLMRYRPRAHYLALSPADADLAYLQERCQPLLSPENTVILDDIHHLAESSKAGSWLADLLERPRPAFVLAGRRNPLPPGRPLSPASTQLASSDLAFTLEETLSLLAGRKGSHAALVAWHQRARGWPLAMALLARQENPQDAPDLAQDQLFAYLAGSLLASLRPQLRHFMYLTALPLRFDAELAAFLAPADSDPHALLAELRERSLFVEPADQPGWYRYHELIRDFLLQSAPFAVQPLFRRIVAWFEAREDRELAIEHALAGQLQDDAARLLLQLPGHYISDRGRHHTYHRWVLSLDEATRAAHPQLLLRLGREIHSIGWRREAWTYLQQGLELAESRADPLLRLEARFCMARAHYVEGSYEPALALSRQILDDEACTDAMRLEVLSTRGTALIRAARFQEARRAYDEAAALAQRLGDESMLRRMRHNLATYVLIPLGRFEQGRAVLEANQAGGYFDSRPNALITHLWGWCEYERATANWVHLKQRLQQVATLRAQIETEEAADEFWCRWFSAMADIGQGHFASATEALRVAEPSPRATLNG